MAFSPSSPGYSPSSMSLGYSNASPRYSPTSASYSPNEISDEYIAPKKISTSLFHIELNQEMMVDKNLSMEDIAKKINLEFDDGLTCIFNDDNAEKIIFRIRITSEETPLGTAVISIDAITILAHVNSTMNPISKIVPSKTILGVKSPPFTIALSSYGPNFFYPTILKPNIIASGLNILVAWNKVASPTKLLVDDPCVKFIILSRTSMSCMFVAGTVVNLKIIHAYWIPVVMKPALMTTVVVTNNEGNPMKDATRSPSIPSFNFGFLDLEK
eukprot:Gb_27139 [translate_table: standard]